MDEKYQIVIVGVSEKQKKKLPSNIIGITRTNSTKELSEIYTASDIFVNPTLEDNYPTTNLEAICCGTRVLTFNTGGSCEGIEDKYDLSVKKGDLDSLLYQIINQSNYNKKFRKIDVSRYSNISKYNEYVKYYNVEENNSE